jgi:hypothetical protein
MDSSKQKTPRIIKGRPSGGNVFVEIKQLPSQRRPL